MKKYLLLAILSFSVLITNSQSLNFGIEFMQRNNVLSGQPTAIDHSYNFNSNGFNNYGKFADFYAIDYYNDTMAVQFEKFTVSNNFELPLYLRYKFKKRWTVDLNFSTSKYDINLKGTNNYTGNFLSKYYMSETEYNNYIQNNYSYYDSTQYPYTHYLSSIMQFEETETEYTEKFKLTTLGTNISYSFLPHKTTHPYAFIGFGYRAKSKQYEYSDITMRNKYLKDQQYLNEGVMKFAANTFQFRLGAGVESYRFRMGCSFDFNMNGEYAKEIGSQKNVFRKKGTTPYDNLRSFSFFVSSDILTKNFAAKKQISENSDVISIDKLEIKKSRHQFGFRAQKVGTSKINDYGYSSKPLTFALYKNVPLGENYQKDSVSFVYKIQTVSFRGISLVDYKPKIEGYYRMSFLKKFEWETSIGWQALTVDMKTRESEELYRIRSEYYDGSGYYEFYDEIYNDQSASKTFRGAYRNNYNIINLDQAINYNIIQNDFMKLKGSLAISFNYYEANSQRKNLEKNTNSLDLSNYIDNIYMSGSTTLDSINSSLFVANEDVDVKLGGQGYSYIAYDSNWDEVYSEDDYSKLGSYNLINNEQNNYKSWITKYKHNNWITSFRFGLEAEIDRFSFGLNYEKSIGNGDGLIIKNYSRLNFTVGYILYRK